MISVACMGCKGSCVRVTSPRREKDSQRQSNIAKVQENKQFLHFFRSKLSSALEEIIVKIYFFSAIFKNCCIFAMKLQNERIC
jgi:hypothetical protein